MSWPVGYLINRPSDLEGERGQFYDYILAGNGLFIEADGKHLSGRVQLTRGEIRGLAEASSAFELKHGHIPGQLLDLALSAMLARKDKEVYIGIRWGGERYELYLPEQQGTPASVQFEQGDGIVVDLHSHGAMRAHFSGRDDADEQGLRIYGVIGRPPRRPEIALRLGIYGYWCPLMVSDVFRGSVAIVDRSEEAACRICGCTDSEPCLVAGVPCHWVEPDLCSSCADAAAGHSAGGLQ